MNGLVRTREGIKIMRTNRKHQELPEGKMKKFIHDPFNVTIKDIEAICSKEGVITVRQLDGNVYDEVHFPVSTLYKILNLVEESRTVKIVDREEFKKELGNE